MQGTIRFILLTAFRSRLFLGLAGLLVAAVGIAALLGHTSLIEQEAMRTVYAAGVMRFTAAAGMIVFICFQIQRAWETGDIEVMLSRPMTRAQFIVACWCGFAAVALILGGMVALLSATLLVSHDPGSLLLWCASVGCELLQVTAVALFFALLLRNAVTAALGALAFYVSARLMGFFVAMLNTPSLQGESLWNWVNHGVITAMSAILPRFDMLGDTAWLVYGAERGVLFLPALQALIYIPLVLSLITLDMRNRQR